MFTCTFDETKISVSAIFEHQQNKLLRLKKLWFYRVAENTIDTCTARFLLLCTHVYAGQEYFTPDSFYYCFRQIYQTVDRFSHAEDNNTLPIV